MMARQQSGNAVTSLDLLLSGLVGRDQFPWLESINNIQGLTLDSREIQHDYLFVALPGQTSDGRLFSRTAIDQGAAAVLYENRDAPAQCRLLSDQQKAVGIDNLQNKVSEIAGRFLAHPSASMKTIGITGTNGKTTCAYLLAQALEKLGERCGLMGTTGSGFLDQLIPSNLTTGDAAAAQRNLAWLRDRGASAVCMEVSSHGLDQSRVASVEFDIAIFTNLSQDHLDYHADMGDYAATKKKLFDFDCLEAIVVNRDDPVGREILQVSRPCRVISYGMSRADIFPTEAEVGSSGINFKLDWAGQTAEIRSPLLGELNLSNLLATAATLLVMDYSIKQVAAVMPDLKPPPGRMELFDGTDSQPRVVVDYSHTPDSLERALKSLRALCEGSLWVVFGCGGDRDRGKRPLMGSAAATLADQVIITNDNPRSEDPNSIVDDILDGFDKAALGVRLKVILDRRDAIGHAVVAASSNDLILIAGKGHEQIQTIGEVKTPFSDREVVRSILGVNQ